MRRISAIIAAALWAAPALAQMNATIVFDTPASQHYQGPGDITAFTAWYGLRAYSAAVAATGTQQAVDLRRVSDNATCTALIGTGGGVDLTVGTPCNSNTQTVTAWIGASSATVSKLYDQTSGNACGSASCDAVQAGTTAQPAFLLTGCGGGGTLPCLLSSSNVPQTLVAANNFTPAGTASSFAAMAAMHHITDSPTPSIIKSGGGSGGNGSIDSICGATTANNIALCASGSTKTVTANDDVYHEVLGIIQGAGSFISVDGVDSTTATMTLGTTASAPRVANNSQAAGTATITTHFGEGGFEDNTSWSSGTRTALCHNMRLYWGTGGSC